MCAAPSPPQCLHSCVTFRAHRLQFLEQSPTNLISHNRIQITDMRLQALQVFCYQRLMCLGTFHEKADLARIFGHARNGGHSSSQVACACSRCAERRIPIAVSDNLWDTSSVEGEIATRRQCGVDASLTYPARSGSCSISEGKRAASTPKCSLRVFEPKNSPQRRL